MQNAFKRFGERDTGSFSNRFQFSLLKLTLLYTATLATILFLSSCILYSAFSSRLDHRFAVDRIQIQDYSVFSITPTPKDLRADLIWSLVFVNGLLLTVAAGSSYLLARWTLEPLRESYQKQRQFLSDASHELRTPLSILHTDLENELSDIKLSASSRQRAESGLEEVTRMTRLVTDLLTLSRLDEDGNAAEASLSPVRVDQLAVRAVERLQSLAQKHEITLALEPPAEMTILTNEDLLAQALTNIIKNAIVHNQPSGTVTVSAAVGKRHVRFSVRDTGPGIDPQELEKVFDRFYRTDKSRSRRTGGSGLGLSIVQSSMQHIGGTVEIQSALGHGTTVTLVLPRER